MNKGAVDVDVLGEVNVKVEETVLDDRVLDDASTLVRLVVVSEAVVVERASGS